MTILFKASWAEYEEDSSVVIFEENGKLYERSYGHNCMVVDYDGTEEITQEEGLETMLEMVDSEDEDFLALQS